MKTTLIILLTLSLGAPVFSQEGSASLIRIEAGPVLHFNNLNEHDYFNYKYERYEVENTEMAGVNIKFSMKYKKGLDLVFGAIAETGIDDYGSAGFNPGSTGSTDYVLNGGGVYAGLNPNTGGKYFGIDMDIAAGIFAYKEYIVIYNNLSEPFVDEYDKKSSFVGGIAGMGFYLKSRHIGISPELQLVIAGGNNGSFLFWGAYVPVTISF